MSYDKANKAWELFQGLLRQYPLWPSTFSMCKCGREHARGNGTCSLCIKEEMSELVGSELTARAYAALRESQSAWHAINDKMTPK